MDKQFCAFLLASGRNGTLYIGVTSKLAKRVWQHRSKFVEGFTAKHGIDKLVWYEIHENAESAIVREEADQEMEPRVESPFDRRDESLLERSR